MSNTANWNSFQKEITTFSCEGACVPALGLSNKSVSSTEKVEIESGNYFIPQILQGAAEKFLR